LSIFFGTMLGVGFGLLVEMMNRRVRSLDDLSDLLEVPVFAIIQGKPPGNGGKRFIGLSRRLLKAA
jgi:succinoglycan biosynthesis transport protein ExoP